MVKHGKLNHEHGGNGGFNMKHGGTWWVQWEYMGYEWTSTINRGQLEYNLNIFDGIWWISSPYNETNGVWFLFQPSTVCIVMGMQDGASSFFTEQESWFVTAIIWVYGRYNKLALL